MNAMVIALSLLSLFSFSIAEDSSRVSHLSQSNQSIQTVGFSAFNDSSVLEEGLQSTTDSDGVVSSEVLVYPSPCPNTKCEIGFRVLNADLTNLKIEMYDMQANKIAQKTVDAALGYNTLPLSDLLPFQPPTGIYHLVLYDAQHNIIDNERFGIVASSGDSQ